MRLEMALCILSTIADAQQDPLVWFPLQAGNRWIYEYESKSGDRSRPDVDGWTTEESITGRVTIQEGLVILRDVKVQDQGNQQSVTTRIADGQVRYVTPRVPFHTAYLVARARGPYLVHENCIYIIADGRDAQKLELRPEYREYLTARSLAPDLCFPLQEGRQWGNNDIPWKVEPVRADAASIEPADYPEAIHIFSSHFGSGGSQDVWFVKGTGVVAEHYLHRGTYDEYTKKLRSFQP